MQLTETIERTFTDVAATVESTYVTVAGRTPPPADKVVTRVGEVNVEAIRQAGRLTMRSVDLVGGAMRFVDAHTAGLSGRVEETTLRVVGRASDELEDAIAVAKSVASKVDRRADAIADHVEAIADEVTDDVEEAVAEATNRSKATVRQAERVADAAAGKAPAADKAYENWTKADLLTRAQELDVEGRSSMTKAQLVAALRR